MRIAISGASGLIGSELARHLTRGGHEVLRLVRRPAVDAGEVAWDPQAGSVDTDKLQGVDAVVNLSGAGVGDKRWTPEYKAVIRDSRVSSSETIVKAMVSLPEPPRVYLQASAMGFYGDRDDEILTEDSAPGRGFLADVTADWEDAATPAAEAGVRTALLRTGLVMSPRGGAFGRLSTLFRLGLGGPLGDGSAWWATITVHDHVRAIEFLLQNPLSGPVNMVGPAPSRNADVTKQLGRAFSRPAVLPVPPLALRVALGEFAGDVLASQRVVPKILGDAGFVFDYPTIREQCSWLADADHS